MNECEPKYFSKEDSDKLFDEFVKEGLMTPNEFFRALNASVTRFGKKMEDMNLSEDCKRSIIKELYGNNTSA